MRSLPLVACVGVLAFAPVATAAPDRSESTRVGAAVTSPGPADLAFGVAINSPLSWMTTGALGGSAYLGFGQHHAIRANVAKYAFSDAAGTLIGDVFFDGDGSDASLSGSTFDLGLAYQYFPRRLFDGLSLEVGALRRAIDHHTVDEFDSPEDERITATGWGVRAMIGWSWRLGDHAFIAAAAGLSKVAFRGTRTYAPVAYDPVYMTTSYRDSDTGGEAYLRLGVTFGRGSGR